MVTEIKYVGNFRTEGRNTSHNDSLVSDIDKSFGGLEEHLSPTDYFEYSIAACTLSVIALKANKLNVNIEGLKASSQIEYSPIHQITKIKLTIECPQELDTKTAEALEIAASHCPVKKAVDHSIPIETTFKWNSK